MPDLLSNRRRKAMARLCRRTHRQRQGRTLLESVRAITAALDAHAPLVDAVVDAARRHDPDLRPLIERLSTGAAVPVYTTDADTLRQIADVETPQGIVAVVETPRVAAEALPDALPDAAAVLLLDGVQDPGNVGTIIRTAAWFGADAVVAGPGTAGLYGPKVMRAAMGGHWDLTCARADALGPVLDRLRRDGYALYGADLHGLGAAAWQPERPSALLLGSEAHGLSAAVLDRLDLTVSIPGAPERRGAESLNVAIASGILVYEWLGR
jgi:TrmH family RNA methyltransferase